MGRILVADDHDALRRGLALALADGRARRRRSRQRQRRHREAARGLLRRRRERPEDGRHGRARRAADDQDAAPVGVGHPDDGVRLGHTAVEAMKHGAFDYVQKPFEIEEMEVKVEKALELKRLRNELDYLRNEQPGNLRLRPHRRRQRRAAARAGGGPQGGQEQLHRADSRRNRHRQGTDRRRHPPQLAALGPQLRQGQLRRAAGEPARIGTVRPREGRVHRRRSPAHRPLRAGRRRHAVPRRNRRHEPQHAGQDPARAAGARVRAPRRHAHHSRRRAPHRRHQPRPVGDGGRRRSSAKTSTTA